MNNDFNRFKYLIYPMIDDYNIDKEIAKEFLKQMTHAYLTIDEDTTFPDFFNLILDIVVTLFDY